MKGLVVDAQWDPRPGYAVTAQEEASQRAVVGSSVWRYPEWKVTDRPTPTIKNPDDVLIRSRATGLCGSDLHMYERDEDGYLTLPYRMALPVAVGHEFSGEVVEVGPAVTSLKPGDAVAVEAMSYCGNCRPCLRGLYNHCEHGEDLGFTFDGGSGEFVVARERHCWSLNGVRDRFGESKTYDIGAVTEPTSIAYNGMFLRAGGYRPGDHVAVFGCGPVGLAAVALARANGAGKVIAVDTQAPRRELAVALGASLALNPLDDPAVGAAITEYTRGQGVAMAVDATGLGAVTMPQIEACLSVAGKAVMIGMDTKSIPVSTLTFQMLGATMYGSLGHLGGGFGGAISLHEAGRLDMSQIVTARFALRDGVQAVERATKRVDAKVLIYPNSEPEA